MLRFGKATFLTYVLATSAVLMLFSTVTLMLWLYPRSSG